MNVFHSIYLNLKQETSYKDINNDVALKRYIYLTNNFISMTHVTILKILFYL